MDLSIMLSEVSQRKTNIVWSQLHAGSTFKNTHKQGGYQRQGASDEGGQQVRTSSYVYTRDVMYGVRAVVSSPVQYIWKLRE